nr:conotoxin precursor D [Conus judaeus]
MPRLEMILLVLLILPQPYFNAASEQAVPGDGQGDELDRDLLRGDRAVYTACYYHQPYSPWGRCCPTKMCGSKCCERANCLCISHTDMGQGCSC